MLFTTSWDDGYRMDLKIAEMLDKHGCKGTFYVCPKVQHDKQMLNGEEIISLNKKHEVGAHSMTHPRLAQITAEDARREINHSKKWIEKITGAPCKMFCYPYGDENPKVRSLTEEAGFKGARTVEQLKFSIDDPFGMPTSLQIYPFPWRRRWTRWHHLFDPLGRLRVMRPELKELGITLRECTSWIKLAKALFSYALKTNQPFFHLWGHSYELEKYGMWEELEMFLEFVKKHDGIERVVNGDLI